MKNADQVLCLLFFAIQGMKMYTVLCFKRFARWETICILKKKIEWSKKKKEIGSWLIEIRKNNKFGGKTARTKMAFDRKFVESLTFRRKPPFEYVYIYILMSHRCDISWCDHGANKNEQSERRFYVPYKVYHVWEKKCAAYHRNSFSAWHCALVWEEYGISKSA